MKAKETFPDLMIIDKVMPMMDGYHVCESIREDSELKDVPILMLTGSEASVGDIQKAHKLKLSGYIKKTSDMDGLLNRVRELFKKEEQQFFSKKGPLNFYSREKGTIIILPFNLPSTIERLVETLDYLAEKSISNVVIDLTRVNNIDDMLLGRISEIRYDNLAKFNDIKLYIADISSGLKGSLETYSLPFYKSANDALNDFAETINNEDLLRDMEAWGDET